MDPAVWPALSEKFAALFATRPRDAWCVLLEGTDACFAPVLDMAEAPLHPHNAARGTFVTRDGVKQPGPAPRFSRTKPEMGSPPSARGADSREVLAGWGFPAAEIDRLMAAGIVGVAGKE